MLYILNLKRIKYSPEFVNKIHLDQLKKKGINPNWQLVTTKDGNVWSSTYSSYGPMGSMSIARWKFSYIRTDKNKGIFSCKLVYDIEKLYKL